jgi:magnesium chelatase family protein
MTFPAGFMLVAAMNPCPCGYFGDPQRECRCSPAQIERYRNRISGPLLDRIDIHVEAPAVVFKELSGGQPGEPSGAIRERVLAARAVQQSRFGGSSAPPVNARMAHKKIKESCVVDEASTEMLRHAMEDLHLSARAYDRILKVARTIADLAGSEAIVSDHIGEAIQYRTLDRRLWV